MEPSMEIGWIGGLAHWCGSRVDGVPRASAGGAGGAGQELPTGDLR